MALKSKCASRYGPPPSKVCPPLAWAMSRMQLINPGLVTLDHLPLDGRLSWIYTVYATVAWSLFSLCCGPGHNRIHLLHLLLSQSTNYDTYPNIFPPIQLGYRYNYRHKTILLWSQGVRDNSSRSVREPKSRGQSAWFRGIACLVPGDSLPGPTVALGTRVKGESNYDSLKVVASPAKV